MDASKYGFKIHEKFDKVYFAEVLQAQPRTIASDFIDVGEKVAVSICEGPNGKLLCYGVAATEEGKLLNKDYSCNYDEVKDHLKLIGTIRNVTANQVILKSINRHNSRVF